MLGREEPHWWEILASCQVCEGVCEESLRQLLSVSWNQNGTFPEASNYDKLSVPVWLKKKRNVLLLVNHVLHCSFPVLWGRSHNQRKETGRKQLITIESDTFNNRRNNVETNPNCSYSSSVLSKQDLLKYSDMYSKFQAIEINWCR